MPTAESTPLGTGLELLELIYSLPLEISLTKVSSVSAMQFRK